MSNSTNQYLSKYSNGKSVSAAQYITEIICENKAKQEGSDLHYKFWTSKKWSKFYRDQIASSHKLLAKYNPKAIINALTSAQAKKIYSLRAPHLPAIIEEEQRKLENLEQQEFNKIERDIDITNFRKNQTKSSLLSKLKDIDYES